MDSVPSRLFQAGLVLPVKWAPLLLLAGCLCSRAEKLDSVINEGPVPFCADTTLKVIRAAAPCDKRPFVGRVEWCNPPCTCGGVRVHGCSDGYSCNIDVLVEVVPNASDSALAEEIGHWLWHWCFGRVGEVYTNGVQVLDPDFARWLSSTNAAARTVCHQEAQ